MKLRHWAVMKRAHAISSGTCVRQRSLDLCDKLLGSSAKKVAGAVLVDTSTSPLTTAKSGTSWPQPARENPTESSVGWTRPNSGPPPRESLSFGSLKGSLAGCGTALVLLRHLKGYERPLKRR